MRTPRAGDVVQLGPEASVQFMQPIVVRVIRVHDWVVSMGGDLGWCWLDVYQLDGSGDATVRRSVFVNVAGARYPAGVAAPG